MSAVYVYRLYDNGGRLLYVGQSRDPWMRFRQHMFDSTWWAERVARGRFTVFASRAEAVAAERYAITTEHPIHNRQHFGPATRAGWSRQTYIDHARARLEYPFSTPASDVTLRQMRVEYGIRFGARLGADVGQVKVGYHRGQMRANQRRSIA